MSKTNVTVASGVPVDVGPRLQEICDLVQRAGCGPLAAVPARASSNGGGVALVPGWHLDGDLESSRLAAAAELIGRVYRSEQESASLCAEILERYEEATLIYRLSRALATAVGERSVARLVVSEATRSMQAASAELWLKNGTDLALAAASSGEEDGPWELREQGALVALNEGRPWVRDAGLGGEALAAVPLPGPNDQPLGVMVLRGRGEGQSYRSGEAKLLAALASLASAFIRNERLVAASGCQDSERSAALLKRVVRSELRADVSESRDGLDVAALGVSAPARGSDLCELLPLSDGGLCVVLARPSSESGAAILRLVELRGALRAEARRCPSPSALLELCDRILGPEYSRTDLRGTALAIRFSSGGRSFTHASAGDECSILVRVDGTVDSLHAGSAALGGGEMPRRGERCGEIGVGDVWVGFSEDLVGVRFAGAEEFGSARVAAAVRRARGTSAVAIRDAILAEVAHARGTTPNRADATVAVVLGTRAASEAGRGGSGA